MPDHPEEPPGYPTEWEADVLLTDGGVAQLRPIRPNDAQLLVQFYDRVSPESKYLRFFAPYPRLSARDVARFTQVDYIDRVALIITLGEQMIGVGRYDRIDDDEAEVAFLVEDAHQGRGIAQLLLEHLAEAARERGITKFTAEVLPQNRAMAQVFADAGYRVSKGIEDGVLMVEFPILPTDTSVGVMERREHRAERASISRLLTPRRLVVLGPGSPVQELVGSMLRGGYRGEVIAISTDDVQVAGVPTADSIAAVEGKIDLALLAIPTTDLGGAVIDAAHKGAHGLVVLTGTGSGGRDNATILDLARAYGVRAIGPDALGLINTDPEIGLNATPARMPRRGGVGLFCQSAAAGVSLLNHAQRNDLGLSSFISTGDLADVTGNDVMQYWEDDEATRVCLLSLDSIGNPRKFSRITRRLTRRKPVVVIAPGRADRAAHLGVRGGLSHAPDSAVDALFRQAGVMVVHRRGAMFDVAKFCARLPLPAGPRVKIITNSFTLATQLVHAVEAVGLLSAGSPQVLPPSCPAEEFAAAAEQAIGRHRGRLGGGGHRRGVRVRRRGHPCGAGEGGQRGGQAAAHRAARLRQPTPTHASEPDQPGRDGDLRVAERRRSTRCPRSPRTPTGWSAIRVRCRCSTPTRRPATGWSTGCSRANAAGRWSARPGRDVGAAGGVRDRAGAELSRAQPGRGRRNRRAAGLERRAQGVGPGAARATRPGRCAPQPGRRRGDGPRLARPDGPGLRSGLRACPGSVGGRPGGPEDGAAGGRAGGVEPGGRRLRSDRLARDWTASPANCSATSSTGCRR